MSLAALLVAALAFQLLAVSDLDLPEAGPIGAGTERNPLVGNVRPASGERAILARSIFAPSATPAPSGAAASTGITIAGSIRTGRSQFAIVQGPDGRPGKVGIGGRIGDWRLREILPNAAVLTRGEERITVPFGARNVLPATAAATGSR